MPTSGSERRQGFTLVEMLVVLVVIGLSLGVLLSAGLLDREQDAEDQLQRFARSLQLVSAKAVLDGRPQGIELALQPAAQGQRLVWRWLTLEEGRWTEVDAVDEAVGPQVLQADSIVLTLAGQALAAVPSAQTGAEDPQPQLLFWPTRESTALHLELGSSGQARAVLDLDLLGRIRVNDDVPPPPLY